MMTTAKQMLEEIDEFLSDPDRVHSEKLMLWDVLSALRGPDSVVHELKEVTTAKIRTRALPKTAATQDIPVIFASVADAEEAITMGGFHAVSGHFSSHVWLADSALTQMGL